LRLFFERSEAGALYVIDDTALVRPDRFVKYLETYFGRSHGRHDVTGFCFEVRDYFRGWLSGSGILVSRATIGPLLGCNVSWNIMCQCEVKAEEALGQILIEINRYTHSNPLFLSRPFLRRADYDALKSHNFSGLPVCGRPRSKSRACASEPVAFGGIIAWNGVGDDIGAEEFVENAGEMMEGLPDNLGISWDTVHPYLCLNADATFRGGEHFW
jgi:hypothetical protein